MLVSTGDDDCNLGGGGGINVMEGVLLGIGIEIGEEEAEAAAMGIATQRVAAPRSTTTGKLANSRSTLNFPSVELHNSEVTPFLLLPPLP